MQSYGVRSAWDVRDSWHIPSKSAVVGIIAQALGIHDNDGVVGISNSITSMDVRVDNPGRFMVDYQTVRNSVKAKSGKVELRNQGIVSNREFLADAVFRVVLTTNRATEFNEALRNPKGVVFLGRKSYPPTCPVYMDKLDPDPPGSTWWKQTTPEKGQLVRDHYLSYDSRSFLPRYVVNG